jgi:hypothetical protein
MVIAALVCFAVLLVAWVMAPNGTVMPIPIETEGPSDLSEEAQRVLAAA